MAVAVIKFLVVYTDVEHARLLEVYTVLGHVLKIKTKRMMLMFYFKYKTKEGNELEMGFNGEMWSFVMKIIEFLQQ